MSKRKCVSRCHKLNVISKNASELCSNVYFSYINAVYCGFIDRSSSTPRCERKWCTCAKKSSIEENKERRKQKNFPFFLLLSFENRTQRQQKWTVIRIHYFFSLFIYTYIFSLTTPNLVRFFFFPQNVITSLSRVTVYAIHLLKWSRNNRDRCSTRRLVCENDKHDVERGRRDRGGWDWSASRRRGYGVHVVSHTASHRSAKYSRVKLD